MIDLNLMEHISFEIDGVIVLELTGEGIYYKGKLIEDEGKARRILSEVIEKIKEPAKD